MHTEIKKATYINAKVNVYCCDKIKKAIANGNIRWDSDGYLWLADTNNKGKMIIGNCPFCGSGIDYRN